MTHARALGFLVAALTLAGCNCGGSSSGDGGTGGSAGGGSDAGGGHGGGGQIPDAGPSIFTDFPAAPSIIGTLPADTATVFASGNDGGTVDGGAGPCLLEPSLGALIPTNWTPLFLEWKGLGNTNVYEVRVHVSNQTNDYVAYTSDTTFALPTTVWNALALHSAGLPLTLTLRAAQVAGSSVTAGPFLGAQGDVLLAPVAAEGNVVYWTTTGGSKLKGFTIGSLQPVLVLDQTPPGSQYTCIGCHTSSPDGKYTFVSAQSGGSYGVDAYSVDGHGTHVAPGDATPNALAWLARRDQTLPQLSLAHYSASDAVVVTVLNNNDTAGRAELVWTDLHANDGGTGIIARTGDNAQAALPSFSHDGRTIAYVSTNGVIDGRSVDQACDIYTVPYNGHDGGAATPLAGASNAQLNEVYPAYSPDDTMLAFNQMPGGNTYNEPKAEVFLVPAGGGTAKRSVANDPPACSGKMSPGLTNSWPRWAPVVTRVGTKSYYWLTFSSTRRDASNNEPQLYVSGVVVDSASGSNVITTYPAVYVRSQVPNEANHTPAWDVFQIEIN